MSPYLTSLALFRSVVTYRRPHLALACFDEPASAHLKLTPFCAVIQLPRTNADLSFSLHHDIVSTVLVFTLS